MLVLLSEGSFTATYKYGLMLALIDLAVEGTAEGRPPTSVTTRQIAERLLALYWPHARPYPRWPEGASADGRAELQQNRGVQAGIVRAISDLQARLSRPCATPEAARRADPAAYEVARFEVEWLAASQPIPRLQLIAGRVQPFLYRIAWTVEQSSGKRIEPDLPLIRRGALRRGAFDNRLVFVQGVPDQLVALAAVLRPLIQRQWSDSVARLNGLPERHLEAFLFGPERVDLAPVRGPLLDLQLHRCFYCGARVRAEDAHVDHFLPWSRVPLDDLGNLVAADSACNESKRDFLVGGALVERWAARPAGALEALARGADWDYVAGRSRAAASVLYRQLSPGVPLWRARGRFGDLESGEHQDILAALRAPRPPDQTGR